nr:hypothetical protein [Burkholderia ubonensis]
MTELEPGPLAFDEIGSGEDTRLTARLIREFDKLNSTSLRPPQRHAVREYENRLPLSGQETHPKKCCPSGDSKRRFHKRRGVRLDVLRQVVQQPSFMESFANIGTPFNAYSQRLSSLPLGNLATVASGSRKPIDIRSWRKPARESDKTQIAPYPMQRDCPPVDSAAPILGSCGTPTVD